MAPSTAGGYLPGDPRYGLSGEALRQYYREKPAQWVILAWDGPGQAGARAAHLVGGLRLEQFGVRQDDSQLVVQAVEQQTEIARVLVAGGAGAIVGGRHHDASLRVSSPVRPGSRQSVSTKILTEPPAVRTYSTLPLAIQL